MCSRLERSNHFNCVGFFERMSLTQARDIISLQISQMVSCGDRIEMKRLKVWIVWAVLYLSNIDFLTWCFVASSNHHQHSIFWHEWSIKQLYNFVDTLSTVYSSDCVLELNFFESRSLSLKIIDIWRENQRQGPVHFYESFHIVQPAEARSLTPSVNVNVDKMI